MTQGCWETKAPTPVEQIIAAIFQLISNEMPLEIPACGHNTNRPSTDPITSIHFCICWQDFIQISSQSGSILKWQQTKHVVRDQGKHSQHAQSPLQMMHLPLKTAPSHTVWSHSERPFTMLANLNCFNKTLSTCKGFTADGFFWQETNSPFYSISTDCISDTAWTSKLPPLVKLSWWAKDGVKLATC